jgi:hypothetical protein
MRVLDDGEEKKASYRAFHSFLGLSLVSAEASIDIFYACCLRLKLCQSNSYLKYSQSSYR